MVKAKSVMLNRSVAIKLVQVEGEYQYSLVKTLRELLIAQFLNNRETRAAGMKHYFASLLDLFCPSEEKAKRSIKNIFVVMRLSESNLGEMIDKSVMDISNVKVLMYNLLCSLNYLHSANIVHRDLKPQNLLVDGQCRVMLCDFGLARTLPESVLGKHNGQTHKVRRSVLSKLVGQETTEDKRKLISGKVRKIQKLHQDAKRSLSPHVASRWYRSPELILLEKKYDQAVDIWSAGCIMLELLCHLKFPHSPLSSKVAFKGGHCYPLTQNEAMGGDSLDETDQLRVIIKKIGK